MKRISLLFILFILFTNFKCTYDEVIKSDTKLNSRDLDIDLEITYGTFYYYNLNNLKQEFDWNQVQVDNRSGFGYISKNTTKEYTRKKTINFKNMDNYIISNSKDELKSLLIDILKKRIDGDVNYPEKINYRFLMNGYDKVTTVSGDRLLNGDEDIHYNLDSRDLYIGNDKFSFSEYAHDEDDMSVKQLNELNDQNDIYVISLIKLEE